MGEIAAGCDVTFGKSIAVQLWFPKRAPFSPKMHNFNPQPKYMFVVNLVKLHEFSFEKSRVEKMFYFGNHEQGIGY